MFTKRKLPVQSTNHPTTKKYTPLDPSIRSPVRCLLNLFFLLVPGVCHQTDHQYLEQIDRYINRQIVLPLSARGLSPDRPPIPRIDTQIDNQIDSTSIQHQVFVIRQTTNTQDTYLDRQIIKQIVLPLSHHTDHQNLGWKDRQIDISINISSKPFCFQRRISLTTQPILFSFIMKLHRCFLTILGE